MLLETESLIIRSPFISDFDAYWDMNHDPKAKKYTGGVTTLSYGEALLKHTKRCTEFDEFSENNCVFSVIEKSTNKFVGYCGFQYCELLHDIEILYGLCTSSWGKGYGFEAARAVLHYGVHTLKLKEIAAAVNPQNVASEKILKKLGMKPNGKILWKEQGFVNKYILTVK